LQTKLQTVNISEYQQIHSILIDLKSEYYYTDINEAKNKSQDLTTPYGLLWYSIFVESIKKLFESILKPNSLFPCLLENFALARELSFQNRDKKKLILDSWFDDTLEKLSLAFGSIISSINDEKKLRSEDQSNFTPETEQDEAPKPAPDALEGESIRELLHKRKAKVEELKKEYGYVPKRPQSFSLAMKNETKKKLMKI